MLHGHGDDIFLSEGELKANFSSNVWYEGTHALLTDELAASISEVGSYPEPVAESLTQSLAKQNNLGEDQILVCNGATEAFYLLAQVFAGKKSTIVIPAFAEYEDSCKVFNHQLSFITYDELWTMNIDQSDLVWLCNPNNPDGNIIQADKLTRFIAERPKQTFMVDESYFQFTAESQSIIDQVNRLDNLIIARSMTKFYAIPGLRLGYFAASSQLIGKLKEFKQPWSVNALALRAGQLIIKHALHKQRDIKRYLEITNSFAREISQIDGLEALPSTTTFFLVKLSKGSSGELKKYLLEEHGLLVRDASNFRSLNEQYIRLSAQQIEKNNLLIEALKKWSLHTF